MYRLNELQKVMKRQSDFTARSRSHITLSLGIPVFSVEFSLCIEFLGCTDEAAAVMFSRYVLY